MPQLPTKAPFSQDFEDAVGLGCDSAAARQHANQAVDEVRRAEFFRKGGRMRGIVKGKRWLLLTRWVNLQSRKRQELNRLFALNRKPIYSRKVWTGCGPTAMKVRW